MELISDAPNPVLSGASLTLICILELSPAIDIPLDVDIKVTAPGGYNLIGGSENVKMTTTSLYTSKAVLNDIGQDDTGVYTCSVNIEGENNMEAKTNIWTGIDNRLHAIINYSSSPGPAYNIEEKDGPILL